MAEEYPTLNGIAPSWADVTTTATLHGGPLVKMADYSDLTWSDTVELGEQRGPGARVKRRTTGQVSQEASATFYSEGLRLLIRQLMTLAPTSGNQRQVSLVHFDLLIQWSLPDGSDIFENKLKGCRLTGRSVALAEGTDAQKIEVPLSPIQCVQIIDGIEVVLL